MVAQRDREDAEIMDELSKFDGEMQQQLLELVRTVSNTVQPRSSHTNPSRGNGAASNALGALFSAARGSNAAMMLPRENQEGCGANFTVLVLNLKNYFPDERAVCEDH